MADVLSRLAQVKFLEGQYAGDNLLRLADQQENQIKEGEDLRRLEELYTDAMSDDVITKEESDTLKAVMADNGLNFSGAPLNDGNIVVDGTWSEGETLALEATDSNGVSEESAADAREFMEAQLGEVTNAQEALEADTAQTQLRMQLGVDGYTRAMGEKSSLEKRMNDLRSDLGRKLDG